MIDHCIAAIKQEAKQEAYREYLAECGRFISHNTAIIASAMAGENAEASYMGKSFLDLVQMSKEPEENRTPEEIINSFLDYFGWKEVETD